MSVLDKLFTQFHAKRGQASPTRVVEGVAPLRFPRPVVDEYTEPESDAEEHGVIAAVSPSAGAERHMEKNRAVLMRAVGVYQNYCATTHIDGGAEACIERLYRAFFYRVRNVVSMPQSAAVALAFLGSSIHGDSPILPVFCTQGAADQTTVRKFLKMCPREQIRDIPMRSFVRILDQAEPFLNEVSDSARAAARRMLAFVEFEVPLVQNRAPETIVAAFLVLAVGCEGGEAKGAVQKILELFCLTSKTLSDAITRDIKPHFSLLLGPLESAEGAANAVRGAGDAAGERVQ